jgi:hypothetical protein
MQHKKVRKQPLNLGRLESPSWTYMGVISLGIMTHPRVKLLGDVQLRRQPKNLSKLS